MGVTNFFHETQLSKNTSMIELFIILAFLISCIIARVIIPKITVISKRKKLFDMPDKRKLHTDAIPRLGGVSFFPVVIFSMAFSIAMRYVTNYPIASIEAKHILLEFLFLLCGLTLLYLVGIADDLVGVRYRKKLLIQILSALFLPLSGVYINDFYGIFGIHVVPAYMGVPLTLFLVVFITNAINLIDGIDGLASSLCSVALLALGFLFYKQNLWAYSMLAVAVLGVLIPFFYYNVFGRTEKSTKIFMGDTGSLTLGYLLSFLSIKYAMYSPDIAAYSDGAILISFSVLMIPMFDVVRVVLLRMRNGKNIFQPDRNHLHHKFLAMGLSHRKTMILILVWACVFAVCNIALLPHVNINVLFIGDIIIWTLMNVLFDYLRNKHQATLAK